MLRRRNTPPKRRPTRPNAGADGPVLSATQLRVEVLQLANDARMTADQIAASLGISADEVQKILLGQLEAPAESAAGARSPEVADVDLRAEVLRLHTEAHRPPGEIATALGIDVERVEGYLLEHRQVQAFRMRTRGVSYRHIQRELQLDSIEQAADLVDAELAALDQDARKTTDRARRMLIIQLDGLFRSLAKHVSDERPDPRAIREMRAILAEKAKLLGAYPRDGGLLEAGLSQLLSAIASNPETAKGMGKVADMMLRRALSRGDAMSVQQFGLVASHLSAPDSEADREAHIKGYAVLDASPDCPTWPVRRVEATPARDTAPAPADPQEPGR